MMPTADITLNKNSIVKFSEVLNNEGNHFNPGDSVFVSPVSGVFLFSWTTTTTSSKNTNTELRVNNVRIETLHASVGGTGTISVTKVIITNVKKNDHVWIQTSGVYTDNYFDYLYNSRSSFMGFLMYET
jgi:aspartate/tyrosine/aromatic aminotransferase